jgi:seryl-tRNA synthetase
MSSYKYLVPLAFIGMMFFTVGFATGINGYFVPFLENNLNADGSVNIPKVLQPYMGGKEKLIPNK